VYIEGGRIIEVSPAGTSSRTAARVVDAANRVLLPGLFDMHAHIAFWEGGLNLGAGITTVRDLGNDNPTVQEIMRQEAAGDLLMPRIVPAGFIEGESPNASRSGFVIKNLAEAKQAVDWYHANGYPQIKIYNSFPREILPQVTAYAHVRGMRVSGHIPVFLRAQDAVLAGYDEIQHINQVLLNFLVDATTDTRTLERFVLPANKVGDLDFDSPKVREFIQLLAQRKIVIDPTLSAFDFIRQRDGEMSQVFAAVADHVPPDVRRRFFAAQMNIPDDKAYARYEKSYAKMIDFVGRMYRAGVPIVAGTDDMAGFTLQRELELYVQAGLTPSQVLQIATFNGAKYSRVLDDRGVVSPGRRADLILVDGDPTQNISDIRKVALVIKGDLAYYPSEVHEALGIKAFTAPVKIE
jgi:Amidohydrolase family